MHIVFSTDERRPLIRNDMKTRLHAYLGGIARENAMVALAVGGIEDHVHLLMSFIHNQVEHHKKFDFAEEFRRLLAIHGMQEEEFVSRP